MFEDNEISGLFWSRLKFGSQLVHAVLPGQEWSLGKAWWVQTTIFLFLFVLIVNLFIPIFKYIAYSNKDKPSEF